jgi:uncharacterized protein (TIGR02594 family)
MESRLGIQEIPGAKHNPVIVGWFKDIGHGEVTDDETSWCAVAMSAACVEAGLPMPPLNTRMLARSFLTWGVKVPVGNLEPGDVAVWPRGAAWQGHVNIVKEVRTRGAKVEVRCIGGNQGGLKGGDAVTLTGWQDASKAVDFRRPVEATVPALRKAGSSTIKDADREEKAGIVGVLFVPIFEGARALIEGMFGAVTPPSFANVTEGLSYWGTLMETAGRVWGYALAHPWLAAILLIGIGMVVRSQLRKRGRIQEHANGLPIAAEVAALKETA